MPATLEALMQSLDFDADDLVAFRRGKLSERQRARLTPNQLAERLQTGCSLIAMTGALAGCPAAVALPLWQGVINDGDSLLLLGAIPFTAFSLLGLFIGIAGAVLERRGTREMNAAMQLDAADNVVNSAQICIKTDEAGEHLYATNDDGGVELYVESDVVDVGECYTAYYLPHSNLLLALEPIV